MTNKEIARTFQYLGNIMELHGENKFKIRSYQNAYITLRKLQQPLAEMAAEEISGIKGVGKAISGKIRELLENGKMETLERYKSQTPEGIQEMLNIKGFGPKKIGVIWKELEVETIGELLYAVNENRLVELNGFGKKTQDTLKQQLEYYQKSKDSFHYAALEEEALQLLNQLEKTFPDTPLSLIGAMRRRANIADQIDLLIGTDQAPEVLLNLDFLVDAVLQNGVIKARTASDLPVGIQFCTPSEFGSKLFQYTATPDFLHTFISAYPGIDFKNLEQEEAVFEKVELPFIPPELREEKWSLTLAQENKLPLLIEKEDIKGVVHSHTTFSDGLHTLEEMATYSRDQGYAYIGITDHSKAAFYANGLQPERVLQQMEEINTLNEKLAPFKIFKGIESDILNDGSLDYEADILKQFDFIIASVHTNLRMDEEKATTRLIKAIENPYTTILGHPTGRLLLSRQAYPIDHRKIIDACAANKVAIELNANPYRLDMDWRWIPYAIEKGVLISINPDAHSKEGIHDIHFGVLSARKGGLTAAQCLNTMDTAAFAEWIEAAKS